MDEKTNENKDSLKKKVRSRSRLYPRFDLTEAIKVAQSLDELGGKNVSNASLAAQMGKGINNSAYIGRMSSARQFGLVDAESGKLYLTQIAKEILHPKDEEGKQTAIQQAFVSPPLYKDILAAFGGKSLPEASTLGNRLYHDYDIEVAAKDGAARVFLNSAKFADVIQNGILLTDNINSLPGHSPNEEGEQSEEGSEPAGNRSNTKKPPSNHGDAFVFDFPGGIQLVVPRNMESSNAIAMGELKSVADALKEFGQQIIPAQTEQGTETH